MKRKSYDTMTEALTDLRRLGYTSDFSKETESEGLGCQFSTTVLSPDDFEIDEFYRFGGNTDLGDEIILYAISSKKNSVKGTVINTYGIYVDSDISVLVRKFNTHPKN